MDIIDRVSKLEESVRKQKMSQVKPSSILCPLIDLKQQVTERELDKLKSRFNAEVTGKGNISITFHDKVLHAMEFVEETIAQYSRILGVPESGALKKRIAMDLVGTEGEEIKSLIDLIAGVANGSHALKPRTKKQVNKVSSGTINAIRKRLSQS